MSIVLHGGSVRPCDPIEVRLPAGRFEAPQRVKPVLLAHHHAT